MCTFGSLYLVIRWVLEGLRGSLQGRALDEVAGRDCRVLVVGNPCNTNALICMENAPRLPRANFHALTRLDENRAKCQLALRAGRFYTSLSRVAVWGNHSTTLVRSLHAAHSAAVLICSCPRHDSALELFAALHLEGALQFHRACSLCLIALLTFADIDCS